MKNYIRVTDKDITYLSQIKELKDIPAGIFAKNETGSGATSLILSNKLNYIICVPIVELIDNKVDQYNGKVLGVKSGVKIKEIKDYLSDNSTPVKKIMVTYNSLSKVLKVVGNNIDNFNIAVDEFHNIIKSYSYRDEAIYDMLNILEPHKDRVRFISATPIKDEFMPDFLKGIDYTEVIWEHSRHVKVITQYEKSPCRMAASIINDYKRGNAPTITDDNDKWVMSDEAFFFVNCVNDIISIIKLSGISPEETRIICGNKDANRNKLPDGYEIAKLRKKDTQLLEHKDGVKFTFITATGFEGVDIYSDLGVCYIISDTTKLSNCVDISCDVKQICGRIRTLNNPFNSIVYHIYNNTLIREGADAFDRKISEGIEIGKAHVSLPLKMAIPTVKSFSKLNDFYFHKVVVDHLGNESIVYDHMKEAATRYLYQEVLCHYINGFSIRKAHSNAGRCVEVVHNENMIECPTICKPQKENAMENKLNQYKDLLIKYDETWLINEFEKDPKNKILILAYEYLGESKIRALKCREGAVKKALIAKMMSGTVLAEDVMKAFQIGQRYSNSDIKDRMKKLYVKHMIYGTPKASDLSLYFNVKRSVVSGCEGLEIISKHSKAQKEAEKIRLTMEQLGVEF